ncbi:MAG: hypothetical protein ACRC57_00780 [Sarcina sp.]
MFKKKNFYWFLLSISILVFIFLIIFGDAIGSISSGLVAISSGLFGLSIAKLYFSNYYSTRPKIVKQNQINFNDERNTLIRNKAKAKTSDIMQWAIMGIAYISIFLDLPFYITLLILGFFLSFTIIEIYLMRKYDKQM